MPDTTQRAPTPEEMEAVGNDVRVAIVAHSRAFALLQGAADRAMDDSGHDAEATDLTQLADDTHNALIIAIAKQVREAEGMPVRLLRQRVRADSAWIHKAAEYLSYEQVRECNAVSALAHEAARAAGGEHA